MLAVGERATRSIRRIKSVWSKRMNWLQRTEQGWVASGSGTEPLPADMMTEPLAGSQSFGVNQAFATRVQKYEYPFLDVERRANTGTKSDDIF